MRSSAANGNGLGSHELYRGVIMDIPLILFLLSSLFLVFRWGRKSEGGRWEEEEKEGGRRREEEEGEEEEDEEEEGG